MAELPWVQEGRRSHLYTGVRVDNALVTRPMLITFFSLHR